MPRRYIRHPTGIPIQISAPDFTAQPRAESFSSIHVHRVLTNDVSGGGLSFESTEIMNAGEAVAVEISLNQPPFKTIGHVVWCKEQGNGYLVGIGFSDLATAFAVRMVEQICYIEKYRNKVLTEEGRQISSEEAALEWIGKHAADFPSNFH